MINKPKIAMIGLKGLPAYGGAAAVGENIIKYSKDDYEYTVYATSSHTDIQSGNYENYKQIVFKKIPFKKLNILYYYILSTFHALLFGNYDLIHLHHRDAAFVIPILKLKYKVLSTTHGSFCEMENEKYYNWFFKINEKYFIKYSDYITCVSRIEQELYKKNVKINALYIPNGIEKVNVMKLPCVPYDDYILFAAGRIIRSKGCEYLLKALNIINYNRKIIIAGDLSHSNGYIKELYKLSNGLDVDYLGLIKDKKLLYSYLYNARLFVFPSAIEAMSMMLLEAASVKASIICSDIQSNKDIFEERDILYFKSGNVEDLAQKINYALANPDKMLEFAERAFEKVNSCHRWDKIVSNYTNVYNMLLGDIALSKHNIRTERKINS